MLSTASPSVSAASPSLPAAERQGTAVRDPLAVLAEVTLGAFAPTRWAPAAGAAIRPGVQTDTAGGGRCTTNFVFTSGKRTFLGQAAHCAGTGAVTETDGCVSDTGPLGTPVTIDAGDGSSRGGILAYSSWIAMQDRGESDPDTCAYNDFALVELAAQDVADVNPSVPYFGGPTGVDTDGLVEGEAVYSYGGGAAVQRGTGRTGLPSPKAGASAGDLGGGRSHEIYMVRPGMAGDSGSAFLDGNGDAVGVLSALNVDPEPVSADATDLGKALDYLAASGTLGHVELVRGTEPFTSDPPGVPLIALTLPAGPPLG
jgi:hypothetical protein